MSNASIPIPFPLNEPLWCTGSGYQTKWVTCPDCFGTKAVTLTLGNGEQVSLACAGCAPGFEEPRGVVAFHFYDLKPTRFVPRRVSLYGDEVSYSESEPSATCYTSTYAKDLFTSREECEAECAKRNVEWTKRCEEEALASITRGRAKYAWSAHYWRAEVKRQEETLARSKARLAACKERQPA